MFLPSCIDSEVKVVITRESKVTITVKNILIVNNEAVVFLILNFIIKYLVGFLRNEAKIKAKTKGSV